MERPDITEGMRIHYVRGTNHLDVPFTDRHDGVPVSIDPGKSENFPLDMAAHFFGNVEDPAVMFKHVSKRQGWNTPAHLLPTPSGKTLAEVLFASVKIKRVVYKMVEEVTTTDAPIPADPLPEAMPEKRPPGRPRAAGAA